MPEPITKIEENEISDFPHLASDSGVGNRSQLAVTAYSSRLNKLCQEGFGSNDSSTAHEVINILCSQVKQIGDAMSDVDVMIDALVDTIQMSVIEKEDDLVRNIWEAGLNE